MISSSGEGSGRHARAAFFAALMMGAALAAPVAWAQAAGAGSAASAPAGPTLRVEMGPPLRSAQSLIAEGRFSEALAQVDLAAAMPDRSVFERYVVERMRAAAALGMKDFALALTSLEAALQTQQGSDDERNSLVAAGADAAYKLKDYKLSATWAQRYLDQGGPNDSLRLVLAQALYLDGAYERSAQTMESVIARQRSAGTKPSDQQLRLLASAYGKLGDDPGYDRVLETMISDSAATAPWAERLVRLSRQPGFDERLTIDVLRLGVHLKAWAEASPYVQLAERALSAGFTAEARQAIVAGVSAGALGKGPDASAHDALSQRIDKQLAADARAPQPTDDKALANRDGRYLFSTGYDLFTGGRVDRGIALMEQGLQRGVGSNPIDARLRLAGAYARSGQAGQVSQARALLAQLAQESTRDGLSDLARLWLLHVGK